MRKTSLLVALLVCVTLLTAMTASPVTARAAELPQFLVTPRALDFGPVHVGTDSAAQYIEVTNVGTAPVTINAAGGGAGVFGGWTDLQGRTLATGESGSFMYIFRPTEAGPAVVDTYFLLNDQRFDIKLTGTGVASTASVGNLVWLDQDLDAIQDAGEPGVAGALVELYAGDGDWLAAATTDASGSYMFADLEPGDYYVKFYAPAGYAFTRQDEGTDDTLDSDADQSLGTSPVTTVVAGETNLTLDAGIYELFRICGSKYIGVEGTAPGDGWTIELYKDFGGDEPEWVLMATTATDADGKYCFERLYAGTYRVVEQLEDGWLNLGPLGYELSLPEGKSNCQTGPFYDFRNVESAALGDRVWWDYDHDGIQDGGNLEPGIAGITVELWECEGTTALDSTLTDMDGDYLFDDLMPGDYYVKFVLPAGYMFTQQDAGSDDALDSDASPATGTTACTTLDPGEEDTSWDAGMYSQWRTGDSATGSGTRITTKKSSFSNTWFMFNSINDPNYAVNPGTNPVLVGQFNIQAGNPADGTNIIGQLCVYRTAARTYKVCCELYETAERNGSLWTIVDGNDSHLSVKNDTSFSGIPGRDDNQDFCVPFGDRDGVFNFFAHIVVCYE